MRRHRKRDQTEQRDTTYSIQRERSCQQKGGRGEKSNDERYKATDKAAPPRPALIGTAAGSSKKSLSRRRRPFDDEEADSSKQSTFLSRQAADQRPLCVPVIPAGFRREARRKHDELVVNVDGQKQGLEGKRRALSVPDTPASGGTFSRERRVPPSSAVLSAEEDE